ncbi:MAG: energy-coupling factor transporter transmembrane protein EcfT [Caldilineales bacterium]|nr:energy-coupling factor transporter transmembrane protein EcfT [Caldilineales bacterium]
MHDDFHPYTWLLWLALGATAALSTRNPFYLTVIIVAALFVFGVIAKRQAAVGGSSAAAARPAAWKPILRLAAMLLIFTIAWNALTTHFGDIVLFELPRSWPIVGGSITLEALVYGVVVGMGFFALILIFATFNSAVGPQTLLRMLPGFAQQAGVALTIAVSFIPQTLVAYQEIREAQRLRGYHVKGLRDLRPLFVSLLAIGLDRAIQLAESMDARGFGGNLSVQTVRDKRLDGLGSVAGLILLLAGLVWRTMSASGELAGLLLMAGGTVLLLIVFRRQGKRLHRSRYRRWIWRRRDTGAAIALGIALAALLALIMYWPDLLLYYPYPPYPLLPDFNPIVALLPAALLTPALLMPPAPRMAKRPAAQTSTPSPRADVSPRPEPVRPLS